MAQIALHGIDAHTARELRRAGHKLVVPESLPLSPDLDLILMNWECESGPRWTSDVRALDRHIPILAITANGDQAEAALRAEATDVIVAPIRNSILLSRVAVHVDCRARFVEIRDLRTRELLHTSQGLRMASEISRAHDFLERLIDASPDPIIASEAKGQVLLFNRAAEKLLGYSSQEARARLHVSDLYADARDSTQVLMAIRSSPEGRCENFRTRLRSRTGDRDGETVATVGVFRDTRESDSLTSRLRDATNQLIASEKRSAATELAGATAHELNQPLTSVMGILELAILKAEEDEDLRERLERAYNQLERMAEIVRSLSRITRYRTKQYVEGIDILDLDPPTNF